MPEMYRTVSVIPRGVANRRAALDWIRANVKNGVLYFGDDDNTFDLRLFEEIRDTQKVSMFPVGLIGEYGVSAPIVKEVCISLLLLLPKYAIIFLFNSMRSESLHYLVGRSMYQSWLTIRQPPNCLII